MRHDNGGEGDALKNHVGGSEEQHTPSQPNITQAVPFFRVSDIETSLRFYLDGLGFVMTNKGIDEAKLRWCRLEIGDAAIMLQEFRKEGLNSWRPETKVGSAFRSGSLARTLAIYRDAIARSLEASRPFVGNGMWCTFLSDPDGYRIEFESLTDVPEATILSGE